MARSDADIAVTPSILDRLIDLDPRSPADPPASRTQSVRQLKASLRRDLEWLLNTRRNPDEVPETYEELFRSLYNYGLPDVTALSLNSPRDRQRLLRTIEVAIAIFEPRLDQRKGARCGECERRTPRVAVSNRGPAQNGSRAGANFFRYRASVEQRRISGEGRIGCATNCFSITNAS